MPRAPKLPSLRRHRPSRRTVVAIDGVDFYCGPWDSIEAKAEHDRLISEWLVNGRSLRRPGGVCPNLTITEAVARYWRFAQEHVQQDGAPTREASNIREALRPVNKLYGHTPASEFGPIAYKAVRAELVQAGLARSTINHRLGKVRRFFKWLVEHELVPADVYQRLQAVSPLRAGPDGVRESEPVRPVDDDQVETILARVTPPIRAMIELQRLTGMRPGEVSTMTTGQIDRSTDVWICRPIRHKTAGIGKRREIPIGPRGQAILRPWLKADPDAPPFCPAESEEVRLAERRSGRKTNHTPSSRSRKRKPARKRAPRRWYDKNAYGQAIRRACLKAGIPTWGPNRLRHSQATEVRQRNGLEAAQVTLGHSRADVTQVYAERNEALAVQVMREIG